MSDAGYSGTPLTKKLGLRAGQRMCFIGAPEGFTARLDLAGIEVLAAPEPNLSYVHYFGNERALLACDLPPLVLCLSSDGMLWISWPKRASRVPTDLSDGVVRELALSAGLVDVKVAAIDDVWSGLKFVYRLRDRPAKRSS